MPKLSNAEPFRTIYNSTISSTKPVYDQDTDYKWDHEGQEIGDSAFMGVTGRVGMANQTGRNEGDDLVAPHHWDQVVRRTTGYSRNYYG